MAITRQDLIAYIAAYTGGDVTMEGSDRGFVIKIDGQEALRGHGAPESIPTAVLRDLLAPLRRGPTAAFTELQIADLYGVPVDVISAREALGLPELEPEPERERTFGTEPLVGWRAWAVKQFRLLDGTVEPRLAPISDTPLWHPRERVAAMCTKSSQYVDERHEAPDADCQCGLWAVRERSVAEAKAVAMFIPMVYGTVSMWGRVLEFEKGYRAQYAYPRELYGDTRNEAVVRQLGDLYGVPVRILAGPPEPGEMLDLAARKLVKVDIGISAAQAQKAMQKIQDLMNDANKKLLAWHASTIPVNTADAEQLAIHAAAGSNVADVYFGTHAALLHTDALEQHLATNAIKHRRRGRFLIEFPHGGTYEALAAKDDDTLIRHLRGRRPDIIHLRGGFSDQARGYIRAHGIQILEEFEQQLADARKLDGGRFGRFTDFSIVDPMDEKAWKRLHLNEWTPPLRIVDRRKEPRRALIVVAIS